MVIQAADTALEVTFGGIEGQFNDYENSLYYWNWHGMALEFNWRHGQRRLYFMALGVLLRLLLRGFLSFYTETRQKIGQANLVVGNLFLVAWP